MRDKYGVQDDPDCYPGTHVLRNKLGITDPDALAQAEAEFAAVAAENIEIKAPPFDLDYLCSLHRQLFSDVYEFAGHIRSVDISKGNTRFCTANRIVPEARALLAKLAESGNFNELTRADLASRIAELYGEINMVHPFREGNGRSTRLFFEHLILTCGHAISWEGTDQAEWTMACIAAANCDYTPLESIFHRCIGPRLVDMDP